jgi:tetratricopeptide (TPR) repeat protein
MKAEHRKELETNKLADKIGKVVQSFKEGPSRNATIYGSLVLVAVALFFVYRWVSENAKSTDSNRWLQLLQSGTREDLDRQLKENPDTEQARLDRLQLARLDLESGLTNLASVAGHAKAIEYLRRAAESYEKLAGETAATPLLAQEALLNAGKAREALGEYDQAKRNYERLAHDYPHSLKGKDAANQIKKLEEAGPLLDELKNLAKETPNDSVKVPPSR